MIKKTGYGLAVLIWGIVLATSLDVFAATPPVASDVGKSIGYWMSGQNDAAQSLSQIDLSRVKNELAGRVETPFYLSGVMIDPLNTSTNKNTVQGMLIHQDLYKREIYNRFSANLNGSNPVEVTHVVIEPVKNLKPNVRLYIIPAQKTLVADLEQASFTRALELVSKNARKLDGSIPGDSTPRDYLVAAFTMNRLIPGSQLDIVMDKHPGSLSGTKSARVIDKRGWQIAVISDHFSCDNGQEKFFNIVFTQPGASPQVTGVYSTHSLCRRIQQALSRKGYNPGTVDGQPGMKTTHAVKTFQKDMGIAMDGKLTPSLLRLLDSPKLPPAGVIIQRNLARLSYDIGTIDGVIGSQTISAIHAFQKKRHLPVQNLITADLICLLSDTGILPSSLNSVQSSSGSSFQPIDLKKANRFEDRMWQNMSDKQ